MLKSVLQEPRLMDALCWDEIEELFTLDTCKQPRRCLSSRGLFSVDEVDPNVSKSFFALGKVTFMFWQTPWKYRKQLEHRSACAFPPRKRCAWDSAVWPSRTGCAIWKGCLGATHR
ncbi:hypothetical protein HPB48_018490 [Haemaphysalis longicornis]|uniref:Uncharacterized protein n=1 Tax=Haemaphysalis longicornis TaxID=44386 RepID=A0A9J6FQA7_HAELO|nr:hypothetical protein HPB48_018490 [Haemaphysalis longicornis]